jgi:hypothetical protein
MDEKTRGRTGLSLSKVVVVLVAVGLSACCQSSGAKGNAGESRPVVTATTKTPTGIGLADPPTSPAKATPPAVLPGGRAADGLPADIPATRSKVPTLAEWDAVGEITVARSTPLACETKMVREWLRVSCKGKSYTGGAPGNLTKISGCGADSFLFSKTGSTTSLVTPVLRGKSCEVRFTWTNDRAAWLSVDWIAGAPRPTIAFRE